MNFSEIANIATLNHMADYLKATGRPVTGHFTCLSMQLGTPNAHPDRHPSMNYNPHNGKLKCHQCGLSVDLVELVNHDYQLHDNLKALNKVRELFPDVPKLSKKEEKRGYPLGWSDVIDTDTGKGVFIPADQAIKEESDNRTQEQIEEHAFLFNVAHEGIFQNQDGIEQWAKRGIGLDTIKHFHLGYENNYPHFQNKMNAAVLTIPHLDREGAGILRNADPGAPHNARHSALGPRQTYNKSILKSEFNYVFVTEGEIDGLSIYECCYDSFVSLGGVNQTKKFYQCLQDPDVNEKILILLLDNDEAGKKATNEIIQKLANQSKYFAYVPSGFYPDGIKDVNEFLLKDKYGLQSALTYAIEGARKAKEEQRTKDLEEYQNNNSALSVIDQFKLDLGKPDTTPIYPTGFHLIDDIYFNGGLHGQSLVIIGALSSSGKTTFIHQIADNIAESGRDVMIFSLEMSTSELIAKSISRLTFKTTEKEKISENMAKTVYGILDGGRYVNYSQDEIDIINRATDYYKKNIAPNMYIFEGMGNVTVVPAGYEVPSIRERVDKHVNLTGRRPVVIVDYLQILAPINPRATDKQNVDKSVLELKRIARDYNLPVITISSMNRNSYKESITLSSFKESGACEYSSDVLLGLEFEGQAQKKKKVDIEEMKMLPVRYMELKLLKNRNGTMSVPLVYFNYYAKFNYFEETGLCSHGEDELKKIIDESKGEGQTQEPTESKEQAKEVNVLDLYK